MNMTNMNNPKPWAEGHPSLYEGHDITHRPDWANIIVWDAFFNNLTAGFMVLTGIAWFAGPPLFAALLPFALTLALLIVIVDLVLLVFDLGDPPRFIHAMRVLHFTSPLSVGVWGWLDILMRLFTVLAFIGAVVVICYKGVAFSCTSQPGVRKARWLTSFMVSDALLMGCGLYAIMAACLGFWDACAYLLLPFIILEVARAAAFSLLWMETAERARKVYSGENTLLRVWVYLIGGLLAAVLAFFGVYGMCAAGALVLLTGVFERYWLIGITKKI